MSCRSVIYSAFAILLFTLPEGLPVNIWQDQSEEALMESTEALKESCDRVLGPGTFARDQRLQNAQKDANTCLRSFVNITELNQEMSEATLSGNFEIIFRKYCRKYGTLKGCISNWTSTIEQCLEEQYKELMIIVQSISEALLEYLCYKEGETISLFFAKGGPQCIELNQKKIQKCVKSTGEKYLQTLMREFGNRRLTPSMEIGEKECLILEELSHCVVTSLEECPEPTPAKIIEGLFQNVKKKIPICKEIKPHSVTMQSEASNIWKIPVLYLTILIFLAKKLVS